MSTIMLANDQTAVVNFELGFVKIEGNCIFSSKHHEVHVRVSEFKRWMEGYSLDESFPTMMPSDKKFLRCGMHPTIFEEV